MSKLPLIWKQPVAWGDMDAFGHVNNVQYLRYFETARVKYFEDLMTGEKGKGPVQPVVASLTADYKAPVTYPDTLEVKLGVTEMGNSSLKMRAEMHSAKGYLAVVAHCSIVMFDFVKKRPARISDELRQFIEELEAKAKE
ncbi:acyl-CoA thioesterase [Saprospira grandis]|uniref:Thioesterase n=1 Tax=Saprospira grandis (strain Lewin) TaxID=984262 RepID=H6L764_SAPGL|nr:thioesterase family protein [Saprospira grandis]AFC26655.1 putative thioesterase [Saprospira grandis str. Lewin]